MAVRYCKNGHEHGMRKKSWENVVGSESDLEHCDECGEVILAWGLRKKLVEIAKKNQTRTYGKLYNRRWVGSLIGEISIYEYVQKRPLLSALAVRKDTGKPGGGFFALPGVPEDLRRRGDEIKNPKLNSSEISFWNSEKRKVYEYWQKQETE